MFSQDKVRSHSRAVIQRDANSDLQGAQWPAMGKELLSKPIFRESLKQTQVFLDELKCSWDIIQELERTTDSQMDLPEFSQPICTAIQLGLTDLLRYCKWILLPSRC